MSQEIRQTSFAGGEFSPNLHSRTELERYGIALKRCFNAFPTEHGNIFNRAGTEYVAAVRSNLPAKLRRFYFSDDQAYLLELTASNMRVLHDGALIAVPSATAWSALTTYAPGDLAAFSGTVYVCLAAALGAPQAPSHAAYWSAIGATGAAATYAHPFSFAELERIKLAQSADVVSTAHRAHTPGEFRRYAHESWLHSDIGWTRDPAWTPYVPAARKSDLSAPDGTHPRKEWQWQVTTIGRRNGRLFETAPVTIDQKVTTSTALWDADTVYVLHDQVYYEGLSYRCITGLFTGGKPPPLYPGVWELYGATTFTYEGLEKEIVLYPDRTIRIEWTELAGDVCFYNEPAYEVVAWRVYRGRNGIFGYVGETAVRWFIDDGQMPDFAVTPPSNRNPFNVGTDDAPSYEYPDVVAYHEGRRYYARLGRVQGSCIEDYSRFDFSNPTRDDEAVDFTLASRHYEEIRSLVSLDSLLALSATSEWDIRGSGQDEPITPNSVLARCAADRGSTWLDPLVVGAAALHVQSRGARVRELAFEGQSGRYAGGDLTIFSRHLFEGRSIVDWCHQEYPDSIVWCVLSDGTMLSMTYHREQQIVAWARHTIQGGIVEACASVVEDGEDRVYLVVNRAGTRNIERFASRAIDPDDTSTWRFLDCSVTVTGTALTSVAGGPWPVGATVYALADGVPSGPYTVGPGGSISIADDFPDGVAHLTVGYLYDVEVETLPAPPARGNQKAITKVTAEVESAAAAISAGETLDDLTASETRKVSDGYGAIPLEVRDVSVRPSTRWGLKGSVAFRVSSPTPFSLLAIRRELEVAGR